MSSRLPGQRDGYNAIPVNFLRSMQGFQQIPAAWISEARSYAGKNTSYPYELRPGTLMGIITASNKWTPMKRTTVAAGGAATSSATHTVVDAANFKVGDTITIGNDTGKVIQSINYSTNAITCTTTLTSVDGENVVAEDGSQTFRGILLDHVRLLDEDNITRDKQARICVGGLIEPDAVYGDVSAARTVSDTSRPALPFVWADQVGLS